MSMQEKFTAAAQSNTAPPTCPQCSQAMNVRQVSPVLFASDIDDITYGCEKCGTEAKRSVKRGQAAVPI